MPSRKLTFWEALQCPLAAYVSPAAWVPILSAGHKTSTTFVMPSVPVETAPHLVEASVAKMLVEPVRFNSYMEMQPNYDSRIDVWVVTQLGWLDLMRVNYSKDESTGRTLIRVAGWSTGFLPLTIPGAALLNIALFFVPFGGVSFARLGEFKDAMQEAAGSSTKPAVQLHTRRKDEI